MHDDVVFQFSNSRSLKVDKANRFENQLIIIVFVSFNSDVCISN